MGAAEQVVREAIQATKPVAFLFYLEQQKCEKAKCFQFFWGVSELLEFLA